MRCERLQIALDGNSHQVDERTEVRTPQTAFAPQRYTQPESESALEVDVEESERVGRNQKQAAHEIR